VRAPLFVERRPRLRMRCRVGRLPDVLRYLYIEGVELRVAFVRVGSPGFRPSQCSQHTTQDLELLSSIPHAFRACSQSAPIPRPCTFRASRSCHVASPRSLASCACSSPFAVPLSFGRAAYSLRALRVAPYTYHAPPPSSTSTIPHPTIRTIPRAPCDVLCRSIINRHTTTHPSPTCPPPSTPSPPAARAVSYRPFWLAGSRAVCTYVYVAIPCTAAHLRPARECEAVWCLVSSGSLRAARPKAEVLQQWNEREKKTGSGAMGRCARKRSRVSRASGLLW
jgi:hypothetical protein